MKAIAQIEPDGRLTIDFEVMREAGFVPGERVELERRGDVLLVSRERNVDRVFANWGGLDRDRPPMSLEEIVAEQREMRGHDDLG